MDGVAVLWSSAKRIVARALAIAILISGSAVWVSAETRVALVIGNGHYRAAGTLANPVNDARDIAAKLRRMGFEVIDGFDLDKRGMELQIGRFAARLDAGSTGLFYFAGHGIAVNHQNYLLPVDAALDRPAKLKLETLAADDIVDMMGQSAKVSIIVLDACRNNPFARGLSANGGNRGVQAYEGLARMEAASGAFIAFSTKPGFMALDGAGRNSPFAMALLRNMDSPGLAIGEMMRRVRNEVLEATEHFQRPQWDDDLTQSFSLMPVVPSSPLPLLGKPPEMMEADTFGLPEEIESFIRDGYLMPDPRDVEGGLRNIFAADVVSFGLLYRLDELVTAKSRWLSAFARWNMRLLPGSLTVSKREGPSVLAEFDVDYTFWPKRTGTAALEGRSRIALVMERDAAGWKILAEKAVDKMLEPVINSNP